MSEANSYDNQDHRPRGPRLYHKKSRTGCLRCKQRRVKCDEAHPSCGGCARHMVECVYPKQSSGHGSSPTEDAPATRAKTRAKLESSKSSASPPETRHPRLSLINDVMLSPPTTEYTSSTNSHTPASAHNAHTPASAQNAHSPFAHRSPPAEPEPAVWQPEPMDEDMAQSEGADELPESHDRRIMELRLLHNMLTAAHPFPSKQSSGMARLWNVEVAMMGFREGGEAILYGMLAHSALNLWARAKDPKEKERLFMVQSTYLGLLLKHQQQLVAKLSPATADEVCLSSLRILTHAMALVQTLPMEPWEPPLEWMNMGRGAGVVFYTSSKMCNSGERTKILSFFKTLPALENPKDHIESDHSALDWLLEHPAGPDSAEALADRELDDPSVLDIYHQALAYTCSVIRAIDAGEPDYAIVRRLGGLPVWMPTDFTQFLIERRPRALVILAHFMALWLEYENVWIIGTAGEKQVRGIHKNLPLAWTSKLDDLFAKLKRNHEKGPKPIYAGGPPMFHSPDHETTP